MFEYLGTLRWENILGVITVNATICQFLSGALVCRQYVRNKTTGEATALPFLCGLLSSTVWYYYGVVKDDSTIRFVNVVGFTLMLCYVVVFYKYAFKRKEVKRQMAYFGMFGMFLFGYLFYEESVFLKQFISGSVACGLTLLTIASPLVKLIHVVQVKSTECLPFQMILMSLFVSGLWLHYGILKEDSFLIISNVTGCLLAGSQLSLFLIYPNTPPVPGVGKTLLA